MVARFLCRVNDDFILSVVGSENIDSIEGCCGSIIDTLDFGVRRSLPSVLDIKLLNLLSEVSPPALFLDTPPFFTVEPI